MSYMDSALQVPNINQINKKYKIGTGNKLLPQSWGRPNPSLTPSQSSHKNVNRFMQYPETEQGEER
jgi:hypothetical protein